MKNPKSYLVVAFGIACSVLLVIVMWAVYGVLLPQEGGHAHSAGEMVMADEFQAKTMAFIEKNKLSDGSVQAPHDEPVYIIASQYTFTPNVLRMKTGEEYQIRILSPDMVHAISINLGDTSYNAVIMPMSISSFNMEPMVAGTYPVICNEYCGLGHDFMYFTIIVEESDGEHVDDEHADGEMEMDGEMQMDDDEHTDDDEHASESDSH